MKSQNCEIKHLNFEIKSQIVKKCIKLSSILFPLLAELCFHRCCVLKQTETLNRLYQMMIFCGSVHQGYHDVHPQHPSVCVKTTSVFRRKGCCLVSLHVPYSRPCGTWQWNQCYNQYKLWFIHAFVCFSMPFCKMYISLSAILVSPPRPRFFS